MEKKKMNLFTKILIIMLVLLLMFVIITLRKFLILRKVVIQSEEDRKSTNYYLKIDSMGSGTSEIYVYGEKGIFKKTSMEGEEVLTTISYTDNENKESWILFNKGDESKVAVKTEYSETMSLIPTPGINIGVLNSSDIWPLLQMSVITSISDAGWNNKESYKISFNFIEHREYAFWINKEDYRIIGANERNYNR